MSYAHKPVPLPGIGVFGAGNIAKIIIPCLRDRGFKVEAIWAPTREAAEQMAKELDIPFYTNKVDHVLLRKDVDLVCIICPPHFHSQIAVKALGIGKHVLCDRPAGLSQLEVRKMLNAAQYYPSLISILFHCLRFLPAFIQMKRAIADGYIGDITICEAQVRCGSLLQEKFDWMCDEMMGGGLLSCIGSHIVDIISFVTNRKAVRTHGFIRTYKKSTDTINGIREITSDDFCSFQMEMNGGSSAIVNLNQHLPGQFFQEILVCGTEGHVVVRGGDLYGQKNSSLYEEVIYLDVEDMKHTGPSAVSKTNNSTTPPILNDYLQNNLNLLMPKPYMKGLVKMINSLKDTFTGSQNSWIKEPVSMAANFEDGQYVQAVLDAVRLSSRNKDWVKIEMMK